MVILADWITIILSTVLIIKYYKRVVNGSRYLIYLFFFLFYVFPLYLDCLFLPPVYKDWLGQGFDIGAKDYTTRIIYDIAVIFSQLVILFWKKKKDPHNSLDAYDISGTNTVSTGVVAALWVGMIFPTIFAAVMSSQKFILYTPQWREYFDASLIARYTYCEKFSYIGVVSALVILLGNFDKKLFTKGICLVFLYTNICVEGKRSILFFALLTVLLILIPGLKNKMLSIKERRKKLGGLVIFALIALVAMINFTLVVKIVNRGYNPEDINELYTATRIDFLRDDRVRLAIYSLLHPDEVKMIDYMPQTMITNTTALFPIDWALNSKGIYFSSYSKFLTSALLGYEQRGIMTPAMYAELLSNFGVLGFVLMPLSSLWFSKTSDQNDYPINIFVLICFVLLQMYDFTYVAYFIEFTFILLVIKRVHLQGRNIIIKVRRR